MRKMDPFVFLTKKLDCNYRKNIGVGVLTSHEVQIHIHSLKCQDLKCSEERETYDGQQVASSVLILILLSIDLLS